MGITKRHKFHSWRLRRRGISGGKEGKSEEDREMIQQGTRSFPSWMEGSSWQIEGLLLGELLYCAAASVVSFANVEVGGRNMNRK